MGPHSGGRLADDYGTGCPNTAAGCKNFYAVSMPGVLPSRFLTWFQAVAACRNAGKRLLTNQEWQAAALGTPDPGTDNGTTNCNITTVTNDFPEDPVNTGSRSLCKSDTGVFDMVGNVSEWVADWADRAVSTVLWSADYGTDISTFAGDGANNSNLPAGMIRGGYYADVTDAGVFLVMADFLLSDSELLIGFRCGREL